LGDEQYWLLDTNYFIAYLTWRYKSSVNWGKSLIDSEAGRQANSIIKSLNGRQVKIHIFTLAETIAQLHENQANIGLSFLFDFDVVYLQRDSLQLFADILKELYEQDPSLEPYDTLIVASALSNHYCIGLLTFDAELIGNKKILAVARKYKMNFNVTDSPWEKSP